MAQITAAAVVSFRYFPPGREIPGLNFPARRLLRKYRQIHPGRGEHLFVCRSSRDMGEQGEIVIMQTSTLHELNIEHLNDAYASTYKKLSKDPTATLRLTTNKTLENTLERCGFSKSAPFDNLPPSACTQLFYILPKTHKVNLKIRPIVSGRNGILSA